MLGPEVIVPPPFSVHKIVPFDEEAPLIVAVPNGQILCVPPAEAVGCGTIVTVTGVLVAERQPVVVLRDSA